MPHGEGGRVATRGLYLSSWSLQPDPPDFLSPSLGHGSSKRAGDGEKGRCFRRGRGWRRRGEEEGDRARIQHAPRPGIQTFQAVPGPPRQVQGALPFLYLDYSIVRCDFCAVFTHTLDYKHILVLDFDSLI
jgi:hypothetical protein